MEELSKGSRFGFFARWRGGEKTWFRFCFNFFIFVLDKSVLMKVLLCIVIFFTFFAWCDKKLLKDVLMKI